MQEEVYIAFEQYLQNEMTVEDKIEFENQLLTNADLNESFELYKATNQFLETKFSKETKDFKNNLNRISKHQSSIETDLVKPKVIQLNSKWFGIAATIIVFISVWFFTQNGTPQYTDYNQHEKAYFTERSEADIHLKHAQEAFNRGEYEKAVIDFQLVSNENLGDEAQLFYAIALIETSQFQKAEEILRPVKESNSVYKDKAIWYLGLSKLKQKEYDKSKVILETLSNEAEDYEKAQEIIKKL